MRYRIKVAGKIFEGDDFRPLLKRAVEARRARGREAGMKRDPLPKHRSPEKVISL